REAARRSSCQNNLKQWGVIFKMYANESSGEKMPPLQVYGKRGSIIYRMLASGPAIYPVYPEYLTDIELIWCPSDPDLSSYREKMYAGIDHPSGLPKGTSLLSWDPNCIDNSYMYLSWAFDKIKKTERASSFALIDYLLDDDEDPYVPTQFAAVLDGLAEANPLLMLALSDPTRAMDVAEVLDSDADVSTPFRGKMLGNGSGDTIHRLREGVERFMITDINNPGSSSMAQSSLWIMCDNIGAGTAMNRFNHIPGGCNVLYMDGHCSFVRYVGVDISVAADGAAAEALMAGSTPPVLPTIATSVSAL
ncbi:MAG: DUF1559 domain-containing protein, partial [Candidatus Hydrogenedentes bacterium]|nr:DUF1559 domain-containing protein [Candidatus Hydrogenedentota bacterium]